MEEVNEQAKKKKGVKKYIFYISFVLIATGLALFFSLYGNFDQTIAALAGCDWQWLVMIIIVMVIATIIDGLVIFVFCRLYTKRYHLFSGMATALIGTFYSGITPGASGGQIMEVYTLKKQGIEISNAASIFVMWFILYQVVLIGYGLVALLFKWPLLESIGNFNFKFGDVNFSLPVIPLIIFGFLLNLLTILLLFLMSYSHHFHNFIMHYGVSLFAKLRIIKNPDKLRESLRIQVENFKVELRRLQSNIPVTLLMILLFVLLLTCRFSIPWFAGGALNGYGAVYEFNNGSWEFVRQTTGDYTFASFFDSCFLSAFHQMVTGLIPIPGSAGVSELFFALIFQNYYSKPEYIAAAQIIWRVATFHLPLLAGGITSAFYRSTLKEHTYQANRQTFVDLQLETYEERKKSSDTLYETSRLSRKEIEKKLKSLGGVMTPKKYNAEGEESEDVINLVNNSPKETPINNESVLNSKMSDKERKRLEKEKMKKEKILRKNSEKKDKDDSGWEDINIGD
jgi:uncharacterized protein (TIRG00374 family)